MPSSMPPSRIPLHFFWILDCSESMQGVKIQTLNFAIKESLPEMQKVAEENRLASFLMSIAVFSNGARWHLRGPAEVSSLTFPDLSADHTQERDVNAALCLVAERLRIPPMPCLAFRPVVVLVTDGTPSSADLEYGMSVLECQPWGKVAIRLAIFAGDCADRYKLARFVVDPETDFFSATDASSLTRRLNWIPIRISQRMTFEYTELGQESALGQRIPSLPVLPHRRPVGVDDLW